MIVLEQSFGGYDPSVYSHRENLEGEREKTGLVVKE